MRLGLKVLKSYMPDEPKTYKHIENMLKRIEYLEKELKDEKKWLEISLEFIAGCEELEKKIITDREQEANAEIEYLLSFCQNRAKAKKLLHEIKNGKFGENK